MSTCPFYGLYLAYNPSTPSADANISVCINFINHLFKYDLLSIDKKRNRCTFQKAISEKLKK